MRLSFFLCGLLLFPLVASAQQPASPYLQELLEDARNAHLAQERYWHLLLHYRETVWGGDESEVDDPGFFLAPDGKTDPQAELDATLTFFFSDQLVGRSKQPAQCAFIARFHWLRDRLQFDEQRLPFHPCARFDDWLKELNPASISLIFPSAFMDNPVSMFGHTFLRVDQRGQTEHTRILAYTINYAAEVPENVGLEFMFKGVFGGYQGFFSTIPYYIKVQEYRDIENRDMWEYRLNLSPSQMHRLLLHAWEMGNAYFDYFFFRENCAYHILSLLEVAAPEIHLTDQFPYWTMPTDTIRLLTQQEGLVEDVAYRPARSTQIKRKQEALSAHETQVFQELTSHTSTPQSAKLGGLPVERQAFLLDLTSDYFRYKARTDTEKRATYQALNTHTLVTRSKLGIASPTFSITPYTISPEHGHDTARANLGVGWRNDEIFEEFSLRGGYHDLLDPDTGYPLDGQIELGSATVRHYARRNQVRLEQLTVANIVSLSPLDELFRTPSWKIRLGIETIKTRRCDLCTSGVFATGAGAAWESHLFLREVLFAFVELDAGVSDGLDDFYRLGGGGSVGIIANLMERWKILGTVTYLGYGLGDRSDDFRISVGQRVTLSQQWSLRTEYKHRDRDNEVLLSIQAFF